MESTFFNLNLFLYKVLIDYKKANFNQEWFIILCHGRGLIIISLARVGPGRAVLTLGYMSSLRQTSEYSLKSDKIPNSTFHND